MLYKEAGKALPIQVCWELTTENARQREMKGLLKACKATDSRKGIIITSETEEETEEDGVKIKLIPAWKWCGEGMDLFGM